MKNIYSNLRGSSNLRRTWRRRGHLKSETEPLVIEVPNKYIRINYVKAIIDETRGKNEAASAKSKHSIINKCSELARKK